MGHDWVEQRGRTIPERAKSRMKQYNGREPLSLRLSEVSGCEQMFNSPGVSYEN